MQLTVNERVNFLITALKDGNKSAFAKQIGVGGGVVQDIVAGRLNKPSFDVLQKIVNAYPQININWLVTGEGEPFKDGGTIPANYVADSRILNKNTASGNTVSYGNVPQPADTSELEYLRARVRELEQKNNELLDRLLQVLHK